MRRLCHEELPATVGRMYQAAYDPAAWPEVVESLRGLFHGSKACLARFGPDIGPSDVVAANTDPAFTARYLAEFGNDENVLSAAVRGAPVGLVYHDHTLVGAGRLRGSKLWNDWMAPQDMYGGLACKLLASGPSSWFFDVQRGRNQDGFAASDAELFGVIAPHLRCAVEIGRQLQTYRARESAFTQLPFGIVLVDGSRRIISCDDAAHAILARPGSPLRDASGYLTATSPLHRATLARLVASAAHSQDGIVPGQGGGFLVASDSIEDRPTTLSVFVGPFKPAPFDRVLLPPCATVVIRDLAPGAPAGLEARIRSLFDLTQKEAEIAAAIASGLSLKDVSSQADIQVNTVRTHLAHVFRKTGARQQSQLVALLNRVSR